MDLYIVSYIICLKKFSFVAIYMSECEHNFYLDIKLHTIKCNDKHLVKGNNNILKQSSIWHARGTPKEPINYLSNSSKIIIKMKH